MAPPAGRGRRSPRRRRRTLTGVLVGAAIIVLASIAWVGVRGWMATSELQEVTALQARVSTALDDRDIAALSAALHDAQAHAAHAADLTADPLWGLVAALPAIGPNAAAVHLAAESVRDTTAAVGALTDVLQNPSAEAPGAGMDLSLVTALVGPLASAAGSLQATQARLDAVSADSLLPPVRSALVRLDQLVDAATPALSTAATAAQVMPAMLGADGDRHLLVMVQNSAEARTGGGITGTFIELTASDGRLTVGATADSSQFPHLEQSVADIPADLQALYGPTVGRYVMNVTLTPDYVLSGRLASAWWQKLGHDAPDAVIAVDPVVLQALLEIAGPVQLDGVGDVDASDVVQTVLVRPYLDLDSADQTRVQTELTQKLFTRLSSVPVDVIRWTEALSTPVEEGRVSVWSAHPEEQAVLASGPLAGTLARYDAAGPQAIGVFLNDETTGKMDSYLDTGIQIASRSCRADGATEVVVSVTLSSTAPEEATAFPIAMAGAWNPARPGDITTNVTVMVPSGWFLGGVREAGSLVPSADGTIGDHPVAVTRVALAPGASQTVDAHFFVPKQTDPLAPTVVHTPMMNEVDLQPDAQLPCE